MKVRYCKYISFMLNAVHSNVFKFKQKLHMWKWQQFHLLSKSKSLKTEFSDNTIKTYIQLHVGISHKKLKEECIFNLLQI